MASATSAFQVHHVCHALILVFHSFIYNCCVSLPIHHSINQLTSFSLDKYILTAVEEARSKSNVSGGCSSRRVTENVVITDHINNCFACQKSFKIWQGARFSVVKYDTVCSYMYCTSFCQSRRQRPGQCKARLTHLTWFMAIIPRNQSAPSDSHRQHPADACPRLFSNKAYARMTEYFVYFDSEVRVCDCDSCRGLFSIPDMVKSRDLVSLHHFQ